AGEGVVARSKRVTSRMEVRDSDWELTHLRYSTSSAMWDRALVRERLAIRREGDIREAGPPRTTLVLLRAGAAVAVVFCVTATLLSARGHDWTFDEPDHLAYSRRMWETGETERSSHIHF